jgi:hypothetical protein
MLGVDTEPGGHVLVPLGHSVGGVRLCVVRRLAPAEDEQIVGEPSIESLDASLHPRPVLA